MIEAKYTCVHADGALCETCFKYESQLATQTERVQTLEKELEALRKKEGFN